MAPQNEQLIADGKVVALYYTLKDDAGEVLDTNRKGGRPLAYLHGMRQLVPGLEKALAGKKKDDALQVAVPPEEAYGPRDESRMEKILRKALPDGTDVRPGMSLGGYDPNGRPMSARILAVEGDEITIDRNHPLAGKTLHFDVLVVGVRDATAEEKAHGHVHGPGGHKH